MAFNVQRFSDNLNNYGTLQTNKFEVFIRDISTARQNENNIVSGVSVFRGIRNRDYLRLSDNEARAARIGLEIHKHRIDSIRVPGVTIDTYETKRYGIGPNIKAGTNVRFEPFSISVISDSDFNLFTFFNTWINTIIDFSGRQGVSENASIFQFPRYLTSYKNNYSTEIEVKIFENTGRHKATYIFSEAFPIGITNPALSWRDNNSLYKFDVSFAYTNWSAANIPTAAPQPQ
jgi:hypothetical protein